LRQNSGLKWLLMLAVMLAASNSGQSFDVLGQLPMESKKVKTLTLQHNLRLPLTSLASSP
jgi:hypothetical protein